MPVLAGAFGDLKPPLKSPEERHNWPVVPLYVIIPTVVDSAVVSYSTALGKSEALYRCNRGCISTTGG